MTRKLRYLFVLLLVSMAGTAIAQTGSIEGTVYDENKEPLIGAIVQVFLGGTERGGAQTDIDGKYVIKPLNPGQNYEVRVRYSSYQEIRLTNVIVSPERATYQNFNMQIDAKQLGEVVIREYVVPLIKRDEPGSTQTFTSDQIEKLATRNTNDMAALAGGTYQARSGGAINIAGARSSGTLYIVDGMQLTGQPGNFPPGTIDQMSVTTSGIPAKYGDASGGVISITTKGGSPTTTGQIGFEKSLDAYNHNQVFGNVSGPLLKRKIDSLNSKTVIGYSLGATYINDKDRNPNYFNNYVVKEDKLRQIQENPLVVVPNPTGGKTFRSASEYVTMDDLEVSKARVSAEYENANINGKLDYQLNDNMNLVLGGNFMYQKSRGYDRRYTLFSADAVPIDNFYQGRGFIRFSQRFGKPDLTAAEGDGEQKTPLISNAYYSLQADYQMNYSSREHPRHGKDPFKYNYIGKFDQITETLYGVGPDTTIDQTANILVAYNSPVAVRFTPSDLNPLLANYTSQYYQLRGDGLPTTLNEIAQGGGLRNGDAPPTTYGLFFNSGYNYPGYTYGNEEQFAFNVDASFDLQPKKTRHSIEFGLYYQQRAERNYSMTATNGSNTLWNQMRLLANRHILNLDRANPIFVVGGNRYTLEDINNGVVLFGPNDTVIYNRLFEASAQSNFDKNLRMKLGLDPNGTDYINVDAYDPSTFSLDMFSADELIRQGEPMATWFGYDHVGNRVNGQVNFNDWFTKRDANGNYTREVGAFRPNYIAGYIMDKFELPNNTLFHLGVRVERFDANTKVLKDPYSLYATHTVATSSAVNALNNGVTPANIGSDYVVYVTDNSSSNPTVIGYRNGDDWYDPSGNFIQDPELLKNFSGGRDPQPDLVKTGTTRALTMQDAGYDPNTSFTDYKPQVNVMPRISFTFPIAEQSMFYAHYDVLVQRPKSAFEIFASPVDYYYLNQNAQDIIRNPDLKPEKTFDYELGFQQVVSTNSAVTITGFYKERKDMIQVRPYLYAWPNTYFTYGNRDFSTTKGFVLRYDLRRQNHIALNLSYTLQFAEGTGSSSTSSNGASGTNGVSSTGMLANLIDANVPNLRFGFPLTYDSRHSLVANIDYRYDQGEGPIVGGSRILQNAGANLTFRTRSGEPYTRYEQPGQRIIAGGVQGSRLPWHYMMDLRVDKNFNLSFGRKDEAGVRKQSRLGLTAFVYITNLLNTRDVLGVYGYTSRPDDDGWLTSPQGQIEASIKTSPQSYRDLYSIDSQDPNFLNNPRRINLGLSLNF